MREIKFRAWDKQRHHMFDVEQLSYNLRGELVSIYGFGRDFSNDPDMLMGEEPNLDRAVLMQYTGLHDKNGKEIYEVDIVKVFDYDGDSFASEISWQKDYPAFDLVRWPNHYYDSNALSAIMSGETEQTMVVVGNIYENPELLEACDDD